MIYYSLAVVGSVLALSFLFLTVWSIALNIATVWYTKMARIYFDEKFRFVERVERTAARRDFDKQTDMRYH